MFFLTGVTSYLGEGGTERAAAYVLPIGLALAGVASWRLASREAGPDSGRARPVARSASARGRSRPSATASATRRSRRRRAGQPPGAPPSRPG